MKKNEFYGYNPPWFGGSQNVLSRQVDDRLIKNDILQLLLTVPGERVMRPLFGVPLRSFVFEQFDDGDFVALEGVIKSAIEDQDPRVTVVEVSVVKDEERNGIALSVVFKLKKDPSRELTVEKFLEART